MTDQTVKARWMPDIVVSTKLTALDTFVAVPVITPAQKANVTGIIKVRGYGRLSILLFAVANTLTVQYSVSQDGINFFIKSSTTDVVVGTEAEITMSDPYNYVKLEVKPKVGGAHGTLTAHTNGASM